MTPETLLPFLTGAGGAIFALLLGYSLILTGLFVPGRSHRELVRYLEKAIDDKNRQIDAKERALELERSRGEAAVEAARASRDLLLGLKQLTGKPNP